MRNYNIYDTAKKKGLIGEKDDLALYLVNRIAIMNNGAIVQIGTSEEIFKKPNFIGMKNTFKGTKDKSKIYCYYANGSFSK